MPCTENKKGGGESFYTAMKALEECHQHSSDLLYGKGFSCHFACDWIQECKLQAAECGRPNFIFNSYSLHKFLFLVSKKHGTALFYLANNKNIHFKVKQINNTQVCFHSTAQVISPINFSSPKTKINQCHLRKKNEDAHSLGRFVNRISTNYLRRF